MVKFLGKKLGDFFFWFQNCVEFVGLNLLDNLFGQIEILSEFSGAGNLGK